MIAKDKEPLQQALDAMQAALSNHGLMLTSNPPQDAWAVHGVDSKLRAACKKVSEALAQQEQPASVDAYVGAREDAAIWKKRALEAEELNRKFIAEVNGPTYLGEPAQPAQDHYPLPDSLYPGSKDWMAGSYKERVEWLHLMYESAKQEVERLEQAIASIKDEPAQQERDALKADAARQEAKIKALVDALEAVVESRDKHAFEKERFVSSTKFGDYWSPASSMIGSEAVSKARAAIDAMKGTS